MKKENTIKILKIEVGSSPIVKEITNDLKSLQAEVGGLIQPLNIGRNCMIVLNEEGKLNGMKPNRWLGDDDIICGPFFICGDDGENFTSLTDEQIAVCTKHFAQVPTFAGDEIELEPTTFVMGFDQMGGMK